MAVGTEIKNESAEAVRGYVDFLRDLGIYDLYRRCEPSEDAALRTWLENATGTTSSLGASPSPLQPANSVPRVAAHDAAVPSRNASESFSRVRGQAAAGQAASAVSPFERDSQRFAAPAPRSSAASGLRNSAGPEITIATAASEVSARATPPATVPAPSGGSGEGRRADSSAPHPSGTALLPLNKLAPLPERRLSAAEKPAALEALRLEIGDCTRCPLAYAGRHTIVLSDGDPGARLMFVGEGPGADEDESGIPFVGKAGQLLNNMIGAMGLRRESVFIANVVKCRPPKNRVPEPIEANTCSPFLLRQIDIVQPEIIVALGATAATYLLGVKQSLLTLRGRWFEVRGAKCAVTYHPAFLLRDPRQKGEAWKDLQRVMAELKVSPPARQ